MPNFNEVFDKPATGVSLGDIKAYAPSPTVGTEGRERITDTSAQAIKGLSNLADNAGYAYKAHQKEEAAAYKAEGEDAAGKTELNTEYSFLTNTDDKTKALVEAARAEGLDLGQDDINFLNSVASKQEFFRKAAAQGKSQVALGIVQNRDRLRAIVSHPHLTPEILEIAGKVSGLSKPGIEAAVKDQTDYIAKRQAITDEKRKALLSRGFQGVETLSDDEVNANYDAKVAPELAALNGAENQVKITNANTTLNAAAKKERVDTAISSNLPAIQRTVFSSILRASQSSADPQEAAINIANAKITAQTQLSQRLGLSPDEVHEKFGYLLDQTDELSKGLASGKIKKEFAESRISYYRDSADADFMKDNALFQQAAAASRNLGNVLSEQQKANIFAPLNNALENMLNATAAGQTFEAGANPSPQLYGRLKADPSANTPQGKEALAQVVKQAKDTNEFAISAYDKAKDPDSQAILTDMLVSGLTAPQTSKTEAAVYELVPALADKRFLEYRKTVQISPEAVARMDQHLSQSLNKIDELMNNRTGKVVDGKYETISKYMKARIEGKNNDAKLVIDFLPGSESFMRGVSGRQIRALVEHVNQSVRARAHLSGTDQYGRVFQVLGDLR